ncbi:MAG: cytochrome-c oxidase, cbb3-type subunit III [Porticoccus sp.]|jgi:cytochrome c oxidase cbb3-type subunit III|uniref:cytochrome-c oxidase, cbb3-type subunit III n=1 Tax=Porticoccus hydrocarbonoclasticus TaxID=1073414 RepID=UPI0005677840|nr:cytochrome-c oxidase, cbb3-type subunit III [Porticoccus hydrocarbonoclasticus]MBG58151.1 cytochrome-c oxidase, cbb3-type subunit III [Porticoccus sp.]|tara:strand:- start:2566 stop:3465 length:900 start_codon:yes stop_codon:yes gene_type:complete
MSTFWSIWIIVFTAITIVGCTWLLFANRKVEVSDDTKEGESPKTGHVYDGIEEYDNPLPGWWFKMFVGTVVFGVIYLVLYPGLGNFGGVLGWTQVGQWEEEVAEAEAKYAPLYEQYSETPVEELIANPEAMKMSRRLFNNNCAVCHGSDGRGSYGFPNLADSDWLYGGSAEDIKTTLVNGRQGAMPALGGALGEEGVDKVAEYVFKISGREHDTEKAEAGGQLFATYCVACHGTDGTGNKMLGAPNLTDGIWLYGGSPTLVRHTIRNGRNGNMPAQADKLKAEKIHLLTAYVYSLSKNQ